MLDRYCLKNTLFDTIFVYINRSKRIYHKKLFYTKVMGKCDSHVPILKRGFIKTVIPHNGVNSRENLKVLSSTDPVYLYIMGTFNIRLWCFEGLRSESLPLAEERIRNLRVRGSNGFGKISLNKN